MKKILQVKDLNVEFTSQHRTLFPVRGVSFDIHKKEILAIVGESGCGKTVTVQSILKLIPSPPLKSMSGQILFQGEDLIPKSSKDLLKYRGSKISMVFQDPLTALNPLVKVGKQIKEAILQSKGINSYQAKEKAFSLLKLLGIDLPHLRFSQYPYELSGGMRQRITIAIAIACAPHIIIADEPTTALDVTIQAQILNLFKKIRNTTDTSIILISHDLAVVSDLCDRIIVMYSGKILEEGKSKDLLSSPLHPYTKLLLASIPTIDKNKTLQHIEGVPPQLDLTYNSCPFVDRCPSTMQICREKFPYYFENQKQQRCACWIYEKATFANKKPI